MSVLATAASSGQLASSNNDFGGFFSFYFKMAMENYSSKLRNNPTWDLILQDTQKQTIFKAKHTYYDKPYIPENVCQQNPDYRIVIGKSPLIPHRISDFEKLTRIYLTDKTLSELEYEFAQRPEWIKIPLNGLLELGASAIL